MSRHYLIFTKSIRFGFAFVGGFMLGDTTRRHSYDNFYGHWATHYNATYQNDWTKLCYQGILRGEPGYQEDCYEEHGI